MASLPPALVPGDSFVLLDDARETGAQTSRLYVSPASIIIAREPDQVPPALNQIAEWTAAGHHCAGYIAYEAGLVLEPRLAHRAASRSGSAGPLLWFGVFDVCHSIAPEAVAPWLSRQIDRGRRSSIGPLEPQLSIGGYARAFNALRDAILDGDIYQANFTLPLAGSWRGDPLAIYAALRGAARGGHGGIVYDGSDWRLSLSPEAFFSLDGGEVRTRPMKGTRPRGPTPAADAAQVQALATSTKDRAENLMIVDLLRNDLSRVAQPGTVQVTDAFAVETYPTLHQMVSGVHARLQGDIGPIEVLRALFPCGSVTGAPKIRAMELIDAQERDPRGTYCGAIGRFDPARDGTGTAAFNVAIRTLRLTPGAGQGRAVLGVGSALVADSALMPEWRECLTKGEFVRQSTCSTEGVVPSVAGFDLIETMEFAPDGHIPLLDRHLERLAASAGELGFACDLHGLRGGLQALCFREDGQATLRLVLARSGAFSLEIGDPRPALPDPAPCIVLPLPVDPGDWRLQHKSSDRSFYDAGLRAAHGMGASEALFIRDDDLLTEGCFSNIFVARGDVWLTPAADLGLLPGVLRGAMLADGRAREAELRLDDLADGFAIGNALRGLIPARLWEPET